MKKKLILLVACLGLVLTLSACGTAQKSGETGGNPSRHPDFGQPKEQPALRGLVKSVVGNQVVILKLDTPTRGLSNNGAASGTASSTKKNSLFSTGGNVGRGVGGGGRPSGMGGGSGSNSSGTDRAALIEKMKEMSTGEATITIPVGIKMLKPDSASPRTMVEASLADVVADKSITVWLAHSDPKNPDQKIADFVIIN